MIWTDTKNMNGTVGWLKLTGEDDPIVTFFLSLKPNIININARKKIYVPRHRHETSTCVE